MSASSDDAVIVFDGDCVLCSRWVRFLLAYDRDKLYRFAAMQSAAGRKILLDARLNPDDPSSFVLKRRDGALCETTAIIAVLQSLRAPWPLFGALLSFVPGPVRDWIYLRVARNRYRLFGKRTQCFAPPPGQAWRFLK